MMNKILIILGIISFLMASIIGIYVSDNNMMEVNMGQDIYQGPVPLGYDLEHFRETGETIKEDLNYG